MVDSARIFFCETSALNEGPIDTPLGACPVAVASDTAGESGIGDEETVTCVALASEPTAGEGVPPLALLLS